MRNNPLVIIDPSGLEIEVTGNEQDEYRKRLQESLSFKVQINSKTNKVEIVDDKGNILDKKALKNLGKTLKAERKNFSMLLLTKTIL